MKSPYQKTVDFHSFLDSLSAFLHPSNRIQHNLIKPSYKKKENPAKINMQHPASVPFQCMTLFSTWNSIQFSSPEESPLFAIIAIIIIVLNSHQKRLKPIVMAIKWTCVNVWRWGRNCILPSFQQSAHPLSHPQVWAVYWLCTLHKCTLALFMVQK